MSPEGTLKPLRVGEGCSWVDKCNRSRSPEWRSENKTLTTSYLFEWLLSNKPENDVGEDVEDTTVHSHCRWKCTSV